MNDKLEFIEAISTYKREEVEFGKDLVFLCFRNNSSKEEFIEEIFSLNKLEFVEKQNVKEERFALYFVYSKSRGRVYVLRFYIKKIRVITIFPIGRRTLSKYFKRKFKKGASAK